MDGRGSTSPRATWVGLTHLLRDFFADGGMVVTSPKPSDPETQRGRPCCASTLIQPDGDIVCSVDSSAQPEQLAAHVSDVATRLDERESVIAQWALMLQTWAVAMFAGPSLFASGAAAIGASDWRVLSAAVPSAAASCAAVADVRGWRIEQQRWYRSLRDRSWYGVVMATLSYGAALYAAYRTNPILGTIAVMAALALVALTAWGSRWLVRRLRATFLG